MEPTKVLIVDDDHVIRNLVYVVLIRNGAVCETAMNGIEALEKVEKNHFDAVITDIKMPEMDGVALTRELLKRNPNIPVMVMTGFTSEYSEKDAIDAGASDFIAKPFTLTEFTARFNKMMHDRRELNYLKGLADHDSLTSLPNRNLFYDLMSRSLESAKRYDHMLALLFMDIDRFKDVNDNFGHDAGDLLLKETALRLKDCVRGADTVARMGGDEFTIILTKIDEPKDAIIVAERIIESFSRVFHLGNNEHSVGISIGISLYPADGDNTESLLKNADKAMYRVKAQGGNNYQFYQLDNKIPQ